MISLRYLHLDVFANRMYELQNGGISSVEVGGQAVVAGEGTLRT